jgi:hypothetical protein
MAEKETLAGNWQPLDPGKQKDHHAAIGMVVSEWAWFEAVLDLCTLKIGRVSGAWVPV